MWSSEKLAPRRLRTSIGSSALARAHRTSNNIRSRRDGSEGMQRLSISFMEFPEWENERGSFLGFICVGHARPFIMADLGDFYSSFLHRGKRMATYVTGSINCYSSLAAS